MQVHITQRFLETTGIGLLVRGVRRNEGVSMPTRLKAKALIEAWKAEIVDELAVLKAMANERKGSGKRRKTRK